MTRSSRKATLSDIAAKARISVPAVSMALADHPRISLQTKRKVLRISEQLGYRPVQRAADANGAGLSVRRVGLVCVHSAVTDPVLATLMMHLAGLASRQDIAMETLCIGEGADTAARTRRLVQFAKAQDGVLLTGYVEQSTVDAVAKVDVPLVVLGDPLAGTMVDHVSFDFQAAGRLATTYLLGQGHRRIGFVCELMAPGGANARWHEGYLLAHHDLGLIPDGALTLNINDANSQRVYHQSFDSVRQQLLASPQPATALLVSNPFIAETLINAFAQQRSAPAIVTANLGAPRPSLQGQPQIVLAHETLAHHAFKRLLHVCRHPHDLPLRTLLPLETQGFAGG